MKLPDIKEARVRTKNKTEVLYDKYKVPSSVCHIGQGRLIVY